MNAARQKERLLMQRLTSRQEEALGELYDQYGRLVYSIAIRILANAATAEEITMDTFLLAWQNAASFDAQKGALSTWIGRIARNKALDRARKEKVRLDQKAILWEPQLESASMAHPSSEAITSLKLRRERIQAALAQLPSEQRLIIQMAYFHDYSQSQIAHQLDIPLGTVKTRVRLGMEKLRLLLASEDEKMVTSPIQTALSDVLNDSEADGLI